MKTTFSARTSFFALSALFCAQLAQAQVYTCVTANGRKLTSDRPIPECADRDQRMLSTQTGAVKIIKPKKTEAERLADEEKAKAELRQRALEAEAKRAEKHLKVRFPDEATLEQHRAYTLGQIRKRWSATLDEQAELDKRRAELQVQADKRKQSGQKPDFAQTKEAAEVEKRSDQLRAQVEKANNELREANEKIDKDLKRLRELWAEDRALQNLANRP